MFLGFILNKITSHISDVDFSSPTGRCSICGHRTYLIKGSISEDICPWCKVVRLLILLRIPLESATDLLSSIEEKHKIKL